MTGNNKAVATRAVMTPKQLRDELVKYEGSIAKALPKHLTPDRLTTFALVAANENPKLFECTAESIALSLMRCAQLGLDVGRTAYLVPFWNSKARRLECQFMPKYTGLIELCIRAKHVRDVTARVVHAKDHFQVWYGSDERIEHQPSLDRGRGEVVAAYAIARLPYSRQTFEVMTRAEIEQVRAASNSPDSPAWKGWFEEMSKAKVIKRLCKRLPQSPELESAIAAHDEIEEEEPQRPIIARPALTLAAGEEPARTAEELPEAERDDDEIVQRAAQDAEGEYQDDSALAND